MKGLSLIGASLFVLATFVACGPADEVVVIEPPPPKVKGGDPPQKAAEPPTQQPQAAR